MPPLSTWIMAARPRTLSLSLTPVAVGASLAFAGYGELRWPAVVVAALAAALIQIGTNLHNDAADSVRGGDGPGRIGPRRVTAAGLVSAKAVERAALLCFAGAAVAGLYLVGVGGWPILLLGLLSILSGWAYTGGPLPIAYTPLGEIFVLAFFGLGGVCGTFWLAAGRLDAAAGIGGLCLGLFAAAVLLVNNYRDAAEDRKAGRHTLAMALGRRGSGALYAGLMLGPFALLAALAPLAGAHVWLALAAAPLAGGVIWRFWREPVGEKFNAILAQTAQVQAVFALLLCLGLLL